MGLKEDLKAAMKQMREAPMPSGVRVVSPQQWDLWDQFFKRMEARDASPR